MNIYQDPLLENVVWGTGWFKATYVSASIIRITGRNATSMFPALSAIRIIKNGTTVYAHVDSANYNSGNTDLTILDATFLVSDAISVNPSKLLDNTALSFRFDYIRITGTRGAQVRNNNPYYELYETDAAANEKLWRLAANSGILTLDLLTDAGGSPISVLSLDRSVATKLTEFKLQNTDLFTSLAPTVIDTGTNLPLKVITSSSAPWQIVFRRSDLSQESGIKLRSGPNLEFQHVPYYGSNAIWHAGSFDPNTKGNLAGPNTWQGVNIFTQSIIFTGGNGIYGGVNGTTTRIWAFSSGNPGFGIYYTEGTNDEIRFDVSGQAQTGTPDFVVKANAAEINGFTVWNAGNHGSGSGLNADLLDGLHSSAFSLDGHTHDARYYTEAEVDTLVAARIADTGDTMTGALTIHTGSAGKLFLRATSSTVDNWIESRDENNARLWMISLGDRDIGNRFAVYNEATASYVFYITTAGVGTFTGNLNAAKHITTSTRELKKDVKKYDAYDLGILNLDIVSFRWKKKHNIDQAIQIGLIAEDTADKCKQIVYYDENGNPAGIDYDMVALFLQPHVKRHHVLLDQQQRTIKLHEETIQNLTSRIASLETQLASK